MRKNKTVSAYIQAQRHYMIVSFLTVSQNLNDDLKHSNSEIKKSEYQKNIAYLIENKILKSRITELLEIINDANL